MNSLIKALLNARPQKIEIQLTGNTLEDATTELVRFLGVRGFHLDRVTASEAILAVVRKIQAKQ